MEPVYGETYAQRIDSLVPEPKLVAIADELATQDVERRVVANKGPLSLEAIQKQLGAETLDQVLEPIPDTELLIRDGVIGPNDVREEKPVSRHAQAVAKLLRFAVNPSM